jgi:hypothetical protein
MVGIKVEIAANELWGKEKYDIKQEHQEAVALAAFRGSSLQHKQRSPDYRPGLPKLLPTPSNIFNI